MAARGGPLFDGHSARVTSTVSSFSAGIRKRRHRPPSVAVQPAGQLVYAKPPRGSRCTSPRRLDVLRAPSPTEGPTDLPSAGLPCDTRITQTSDSTDNSDILCQGGRDVVRNAEPG
jgi:hypothetical protein